MIRIYQKENDESKKAELAINDLVEKNIKIISVMIRATNYGNCNRNYDRRFYYFFRKIDIHW